MAVFHPHTFLLGLGALTTAACTDTSEVVDMDGDGYSDPDPYWSVTKWETLGYGPDMFKVDPTQWFDTDEDGFGDNWGNPEWNETRDPSWPGIFI